MVNNGYHYQSSADFAHRAATRFFWLLRHEENILCLFHHFIASGVETTRVLKSRFLIFVS